MGCHIYSFFFFACLFFALCIFIDIFFFRHSELYIILQASIILILTYFHSCCIRLLYTCIL